MRDFVFMELVINSEKHGNHSVFYDEQDRNLVLSFKWRLHKVLDKYYARTWIYDKRTKKSNGKYMHRLMLQPADDMHVDHRDNNGLNNSRDNLRICTHGQNNRNKSAPKRNKTGYKGVHFFKRDETYQAYITINRKRIHGGYFKTAIEAAKKYNELAIKYHGEFAFLNKIPNE